LNFKRLPDLPFGLTNAGLTSIGSKIYVAGGDEENRSSGSLFCLDLQDKTLKWERLRDLPLALGNSVVIAQNYKAGKEIFVFGGRNKTSAGVTVFHSTVFAFDPSNNTWRKCADISDGNGRVSLAAGSGVPLNNDQILLTGGDNGKVFHEIETLNLEIEKTRDKAQKEKLIRQRNALNDHHQGFDRRLFLYSTENDEWKEAGSLPFPSHVTATDVIWNNKIVISNGEERPGVRTPVIMVGEEK
jgi:N-acetylneuraminic acid mutarotase